MTHIAEEQSKVLGNGPLKVRVEVGRQWLASGDVSRLGVGSVIELQSDSAGEVDVHVGGRCCARGELVEVQGLLAVRVTRVESVTQ